jgi:hypothetical protein
MADTASDVLVDRLVAWGVEVAFGLPGDGRSNPTRPSTWHRRWPKVNPAASPLA